MLMLCHLQVFLRAEGAPVVDTAAAVRADGDGAASGAEKRRGERRDAADLLLTARIHDEGVAGRQSASLPRHSRRLAAHTLHRRRRRAGPTTSQDRRVAHDGQAFTAPLLIELVEHYSIFFSSCYLPPPHHAHIICIIKKPNNPLIRFWLKQASTEYALEEPITKICWANINIMKYENH